MSVQIRERKLADGSRSLYLDVYEKGSRKRVATGIRYSTRDEKFRAYQKARELQVCQERTLIESTLSGKYTLVSYMARISTHNPTPLWQTVIRLLMTTSLGTLYVSEITYEAVQDLRKEWLGRFKPNTAHAYFQKVLYAIRCAYTEGIITTNPVAIVRSIPKEDVAHTILSKIEVARLCRAQCASETVKKAFLFSVTTGLRLSDVETLSWDMIRASSLVIRQRKTGKLLTIPLSEDARAVLPRKGHGKVFELPSRSTLQRILRAWVGAAVIYKKITFHTARHTFASMMLAQGIDIFTVSKLLGHKDIKSTMVYAHVTDEHAIRNVLALPALG